MVASPVVETRAVVTVVNSCQKKKKKIKRNEMECLSPTRIYDNAL